MKQASVKGAAKGEAIKQASVKGAAKGEVR